MDWREVSVVCLNVFHCKVSSYTKKKPICKRITTTTTKKNGKEVTTKKKEKKEKRNKKQSIKWH